MKNILKSTSDFKIIPNEFQSSGEFEIISFQDESFNIKLKLADIKDVKSYKEGGNVEVFGVNNSGLLYFETSILNTQNDILTLKLTQEYSIIQRREYTRVKPNNVKLIFKDLAENLVEKIEDISAGGIKFQTKEEIITNKSYEVNIILPNNMTIDCKLMPVRVQEENDKYMVSAKYMNIENTDRVILVQYVFKIKTEEQVKG